MTQPKLTEKQLAELAEMLEIAKITEQKARELNQEAIAFELKWKSRLADTQGTQQEVS